MKNIQVIDGARNCNYDIFAISDEDFSIIFPGIGQNIEFSEDLDRRLHSLSYSEEDREELGKRMWACRVKKSDVVGIHGTIFYELEFKKAFYPNKIDDGN